MIGSARRGLIGRVLRRGQSWSKCHLGTEKWIALLHGEEEDGLDEGNIATFQVFVVSCCLLAGLVFPNQAPNDHQRLKLKDWKAVELSFQDCPVAGVWTSSLFFWSTPGLTLEMETVRLFSLPPLLFITCPHRLSIQSITEACVQCPAQRAAVLKRT